MKGCPACKRVENDDTLAFCRADGTRLVSDSLSVGADAGTVRFGSASCWARSRKMKHGSRTFDKRPLMKYDLPTARS